MLHVLHGTLIGQDFAGRGVYVYVPDGTTWRVGEGGYECAKAPDELALRLGQERLIGHHHVANPLDQPAVGRAAGYALVDRRSDVLAKEIVGEISISLQRRPPPPSTRIVRPFT